MGRNSDLPVSAAFVNYDIVPTKGRYKTVTH